MGSAGSYTCRDTWKTALCQIDRSGLAVIWKWHAQVSSVVYNAFHARN